MDLLGSRPMASNTASISLRAALSSFGSCGSVNACHPTIEKMSLSSGFALRCSFTQFNSAPRKLPNYNPATASVSGRRVL